MQISARFMAAGSLILVLSLLGASPAAAAPPPNPTPMQCIDEFTNNDNYLGDGWAEGFVAAAGGNEGEYVLRCGDVSSGVIHIAHPETTGNLHPVFASTQDAFVACWRRIITFGIGLPDDSNRLLIEFIIPGVPNARGRAYVDPQTRITYTTFIAGGGVANNDWAACAGG